jgi:hypothetical protein
MSVNVTDPTRIGRGQHLSCVHPINPVAPPPVPSSHTHQAITLAASLAPVTYVRYVLPLSLLLTSAKVTCNHASLLTFVSWLAAGRRTTHGGKCVDVRWLQVDPNFSVTAR